MISKVSLCIPILYLFVLTILFVGCEPIEPEPTLDPQELWEGSGHADKTAEAFSYWDDDPLGIPSLCAKCHSATGFLDFIEAGVIDATLMADAVETGTLISCRVCHKSEEGGALREVTSVTFPSDMKIENLGSEAICMICHQGWESTSTINTAIEDAGIEDDDAVSDRLSFTDYHYYSAAATQYGTLIQGGYEYEGHPYDAKHVHVLNFKSTCVECHDPHSLEIDYDTCGLCHSGIGSIEDLKDIRYNGSTVDYDGDGDIREGVYYEIQGIQEKLYSAILAYSAEVVGTDIAYDAHTYPYFFFDTNGNGTVDVDEANYDNKYNDWTARLFKAAYNYQFSMKDSGAFAHGGKYVIELLYDSIQDLNNTISSPINVGEMKRTDEVHFDGSAEAFRYWDEDGMVSSNCSKCHSDRGLPTFLGTGGTTEEALSNGLQCSTCHKNDFSGLRKVDNVTLPSGVRVDIGDASNICIECHQGLQSKSGLDEIIAMEQAPYGASGFHYYSVAEIFFGTEAQGAYEYSGKEYTGKMSFATVHEGNYETCVQCHLSSSHNVTAMDCFLCHPEGVDHMRPASVHDYDGDGDITEAIKDEVAGLEERLYDAIRTYAENIIGKPIVYDDEYPYFFNDTNGNALPEDEEVSQLNQYRDFDVTLLKAVYNYQSSSKEPAGYIHNALYIAQVMVDSIEDLGGDVNNFTWR